MYTRFGELFQSMPANEKREVARRVGTSLQTLRHIAHGRNRASAERTLVIVSVLKSMGYPDAMKTWVRPDLYRSE